MVLIIALSIALQLGAAIQAIILARRTGWTAAWSLVAGALGLMVLRRVFSLWQWASGDVLEPFSEVLLLGIAALLAVGIVLVGRSVVAAAEVAETVRQAKELADQASEAKTNFLANMSHELRTPLNAVIGFAQVMRHEYLGPLGSARYREYAAGIEESGQHLLELIEDILDVSRIEAGQLELRDEVIVPSELMDSVGRLIRPKADNQRVLLYVEPVAELPGLRGDPRRLRQILLNLLSNAVKFTPAGGRVELRTEVAADGALSFVVSDTGIGIKPQDMERVMALFGQAQPAYSRSHPGSGLGLSIACALAELHDGALSLQSEPDHGTVVKVTFPPTRLVACASAAESQS